MNTGSRGGFLAFAAVVAYMVFFFRGVKPVFRLATVVGIIGVMVATAGEQYWSTMETINDPNDYNHTSPTGRKAIWERARGYMKEHPVFGVGINNFSFAESQHPLIAESIARGRGFKYSAAHSMWYQVGAETGFPGLAAFVGLFALSIGYLWRCGSVARTSSDPELRAAGGLASALIGSFVAIVVAGTFLSNAYWSMVWGFFALTLGLAKVLRLRGFDVPLFPRRSAPAPRRRPVRRSAPPAPAPVLAR